MIKHDYKVDYLEKKLLEAKREVERFDLELFKALAGQYALEAELLEVLLEKALGEYWRHYKKKGHIQIREANANGWTPVKFRRMSIDQPSRYSTTPTALFSEVLPSGRISIGYFFHIDIDGVRKGDKIRKTPPND